MAPTVPLRLLDSSVTRLLSQLERNDEACTLGEGHPFPDLLQQCNYLHKVSDNKPAPLTKDILYRI